MELERIGYALRDAANKISIGLGGILLFTALLFLGCAPSDQWVFATSAFLGTVFTVLGLAVHFELFSLPLRSREGLANRLIVLAPLLGTAAIISVVYGADITYVKTSRGVGQVIRDIGFFPEITPHLITQVARPNAWLFIPLLLIGAFVFATGLVLRLRDNSL